MPPLRRAATSPTDPLESFAAWFERAEREVPLAEAVCLATVDADGRPDARMVLLKGFGPEGFRFFTNEGSAKGAQLEALPSAALVFYWRELDRQVRVRGPVERVGADGGRRVLRVSATGRASSAPGRARRAARWRRGDELDGAVAEVEERFGDGEVERPPHWGGYRVVPLRDRVLAGPGRAPPRPLPLRARRARRSRGRSTRLAP